MRNRAANSMVYFLKCWTTSVKQKRKLMNTQMSKTLFFQIFYNSKKVGTIWEERMLCTDEVTDLDSGDFALASVTDLLSCLSKHSL